LPTGLSDADQVDLEDRATSDRVNMGIGIVVPVERLIEALGTDELRAMKRSTIDTMISSDESLSPETIAALRAASERLG
jgi:hypothetical protein